MFKPTSQLNFDWHFLRRRLGKLLMGGDWVLSVPAGVRWNLSWLFSDSLFASASENIIITYLSIYLLGLGATGAQIGAWSSLSGLSSAVMLLLGAVLVERFGRRRDIVVFAGGWMARIAVLLITLLPLLLKGETLILIMIGLAVSRDAFNQLGSPAWTSLVGDIVPIERRGVYFGSRNFIMAAAGIVTVLIVGEMITRIGQPLGYQVSMGLAFAIGMVATYSYGRIRDPHPLPLPQKERSGAAGMPALAFLREMFHHPGFVAFSLTAVLWNFSLNVAGPFFNVFMVRVLNVTPSMIAVNSVSYAIANIAVQLLVRPWADRIGARRLQLISGFAIPILPFYWLFVHNGWALIPLNIASGAFWGIYNLAAFSLMFDVTPVDQRARYSAIYQLVVMVALAIGAAVGGVMVTRWGYASVFISSGIGRFTAAVLFALLVRIAVPKPAVEKSPEKV